MENFDYEKAYKAVLQTAKQWIKDGCTNKEKICLEYVFPELRESEDERIRRWIIKELESKYVKDDIVNSKDANKALSWLEKQKEQKPAWSEEDERNIYQLEYTMRAAMTIPKHLIKWALDHLRPQPHWKPSEEQIGALLYVLEHYALLPAGIRDRLQSLYDDLK